MRKIILITIAIFLLAGCRKEDLSQMSSEAASANKGIPVLSEVWINGVLEQKNYYENGRLVRISWPSRQSPREWEYSYRGQDHYVVMTGDYMFYHYYFNDAHQLVRMDVSDHDGSQAGVWVRHEFTWEKDRIKTHSWLSGNFVAGNFSGSEDRYDYKGQWEATISHFGVTYTNWAKMSETLAGTSGYRWHSPFEYRFWTGQQSYSANVYSTTIKMPSYNTVGFPWGYYSIEHTNKHDLMNMLASNWSKMANSGMLQIETRTVADGAVTINSQLRNIVVNKEKLPISYDTYYYSQDGTLSNVTHYEYKYVVL